MSDDARQPMVGGGRHPDFPPTHPIPASTEPAQRKMFSAGRIAVMVGVILLACVALSVVQPSAFPATGARLAAFWSQTAGHTADTRQQENATSLIDALGSQKGGLTMLKLLADNSFDSILVTDASAEGRVIYANKAFTELTGYDAAEVVGKDPRMLQGPGTDRTAIDRISAALKSGGSFEGRAVNYRKDGTPFIMNWRMFPLKDVDKIIAWVAIQREAPSAT